MNGDLSSKPEIFVYAGFERRLYQSLEWLAADPWRFFEILGVLSGETSA